MVHGNLILRTVYIAAGLTVLVVAILHSTARSTLYLPIFLGALFLIQSFSGA